LGKWSASFYGVNAHRHLNGAGHAAMGREGIIDQAAAVLILQSFLEAAAKRQPNGKATVWVTPRVFRARIV
jgi:putative holliday junction resolvase